MKIGVIGPTGNDTFADNILDALAAMGHEAVSLGSAVPRGYGRVFDQLRALGQRQTSKTEEIGQRHLVGTVRSVAPELVINVENRLMPSTVLAMKIHTRTKVVLWFPDALSNVGRLGMASECYDAVFLKDELFARRLRDTYGVNAHYLPEGCTPSRHSSSKPWGTNPSIVVIGNIYPTRARLLERLTKDGVPIKIYGAKPSSWLGLDFSSIHMGRPVYGQEKADIFRGARAVLNNLHPAEMTSVNCRLFEATCAGAVVLCERRPALESLYSVPDEVLAYSNYEELAASCSEVLSPTFNGTLMGDRAARRAKDEHSIAQRVAGLLAQTVRTSRR